MRRHTWSLGLLLVLQACAYQQAMKRGETAAAAQEWDQAYEAYRFANEIKPGKADAEVADARTAAVEAELVAAETALAAGRWSEADDHLHQAVDIDPEHPRIEEVRTAGREKMLEELARRMKSVDDVRGTYEFVVLAKRLHPTAPEIEDATAALRERVEADARALVEEKKYAEARAMARTIAEVEPEHSTRGAALDQEVTDSWVAALVDDAEKAARSRPGLAAVYYARAFEVGGAAEHADASAKALEAAGPGAALSVFVDSQGSGGRHWRLRKALRETLESSPGVKPGWSSSWDLKALVYANGERCKESSEKKPLEKEYVAGTRQVPNPAYAEASEALEAAEGELEELTQALVDAQGALEAVNAEVAALEADRDEKQKAYDAAQASLTETKSQLTAAEDRKGEVAGELASIQAAGDDAAIADAKMRLEVVQGLVGEWKEKTKSDEELVASRKEELDAAVANLEPVKAEAEKQAAATKAAEEKHAAADKKVADLQVKKRDTPEELTEDVMKTAKYAETTWTLTCDAPATVYFATRWKTELEKKQEFEAENSTTDMSRPAHEGAKIEEDKKEYPRSQKDMVAELDDKSHKEIAAAIEARVVDHFDRELSDALAATDDPDATNTLLTLYVGAPERVSNEVRTKLQERLKAVYGLEDPSLLGIAMAKEAPPEKEEAAEGEDAEGAAKEGASDEATKEGAEAGSDAPAAEGSDAPAAEKGSDAPAAEEGSDAPAAEEGEDDSAEASASNN